MPQFFVSPDQLNQAQIQIRGKEARHMRDVLRLDVGDWVVLCDGAGNRYRAEISASRPLHVTLQRGDKLPPVQLAHHVTLAAAIIRPQRFDWLVEKAFELGCQRLIPLLTERTVDHYIKDATKQQARWSEIALSAAKQSGLPWMPEVTAATPLEVVLKHPSGTLLYCWEGMALPLSQRERVGVRGNSLGLHPLPNPPPMGEGINILIGPEGGFSQAEHAKIISYNPQPLPLGPLILRSETAALAALVRVMS